MNPELLQNFTKEKNHGRAMGGPQAVAKQHAQGKMTVRERIDFLADPGSFLEFGMLADHTPSNSDLNGKFTPCDGVVTGTCLIEGRPVALIAYDFTVVAGSMGEVGERKVERIRKLCFENRIP